MKYAHVDADNMILGWYTPEVHLDIPTPNVEFSDEDWQHALNNQHNKATDEGVSLLYDGRSEAEVLEYDEMEARRERYGKLKLKVDPLITNPYRWGAMEEPKQEEWLAYRQLLLDITETEGWPYNIVWPTPPE